MKKFILTAVAATVLAIGGLAAAGLASPPPGGPPGRDPCSHGNTGKPCRPDPSDNGKDCEHHGKNGGVNEDHCQGTTETTTTETTETTKTTDTTGMTETQPTTPMETQPTTTQPTTETETTVTPKPKPPVVVTKEKDSNGKTIIVRKNRKTGVIEVKRPGGTFHQAFAGNG